MKRLTHFFARNRLMDPTFIHCCFFFVSQIREIEETYRTMARKCGWPELQPGTVEAAIKSITPAAVQNILGTHDKYTNLLQVAGDTAILLITHSGGERSSDLGQGWGIGLDPEWRSQSEAYGRSSLFVANEAGGAGDQALTEAMDFLTSDREFPILRKAASWALETKSGVRLGRLRQLSQHQFLMIVQGTCEQQDGAFQLSKFPRLEMNRHKAAFYRRMAKSRCQQLGDANQRFRAGTGGEEVDVLEANQCLRELEMTGRDLVTVQSNVQSARLSQEGLLREMQGLEAVFQEEFQDAARDLAHSVEQTRRDYQDLEARLAGDGNLMLDQLISKIDVTLDPLLEGLVAAHQTLRKLDFKLGALQPLESFAQTILERIYDRIGTSPPDQNLNSRIEKLVKKHGILTNEKVVESYLQTIRIVDNQIKHAGYQPSVLDAEIALAAMYRVIEWFLCRWTKGPRLLTIWRASPPKRSD